MRKHKVPVSTEQSFSWKLVGCSNERGDAWSASECAFLSFFFIKNKTHTVHHNPIASKSLRLISVRVDLPPKSISLPQRKLLRVRGLTKGKK